MSSKTDILPIVETFYSLQGEGFNTGKAAFFIRLAGCRVCCPFCDSENSWDVSKGSQKTITQLTEEIRNAGASQIVITGGEPLMHNLDLLCAELRKTIPNAKLWLETTGTEPWSGDFDWVCLSPKQHCPTLPENYDKVNELKIIIKDNKDLAFAEQEAQKVGQDCLFFLQTEWESRLTANPLIMDFILKNPKWRLSVQMHKYLNIL